MAAIGTLVSFTAGSKAVSADVNANFSAIRSAFNTSAVLTDTVTTITVTPIFSASPSVMFSAAASRLVPGITSFSIRNNANSADNLLITDAGVTTLRAGGVVTAGGFTVTAGNVGIGVTAAADRALLVNAVSGTASTQRGVMSDVTFASTTTTQGAAIFARANTAGVAFTLTEAIGLHIPDAIKGSGSTISFQYGIKIDSQTQGGTNFAISTASGRVSFGDNVTCAAALNVAGAIVVTGNATIAGLATLGGTNAAGSFVIVNTMTTALSNEFAIATTFNSPGNDLTALRIAITDTSSAVGAKAFSVGVGANTVFKIPKEGGAITQGVTLATAATAGFLYIPTMGSTATGTPAAQTGTVPIAYETGNNHLMVYAGGAWKQVALT